MDNSKLVSIIIATYNRGHLISETIESVLEQSYQFWELIIVDDSSNDNTENVVKSYTDKDKRIKYFKRPSYRIKGPNSSRNFGIENSIGDYIVSLDSDDWLLPDYLMEKVKILTNNPEIDGVLSKTILVNNNKEIIKREKRTFLTDNVLDDFISLKISWYMHDILWRKKFLLGKILYNEQLLKMLDRDFHIRRLTENPKLYLVDEFLALYRIHENSNSLNSRVYVAETRHDAIMQIIEVLSEKKVLTNNNKFYLFKHQVQNLVILYKSKKCSKLYLQLIKKTFTWNYNYIKWILKLLVGYISYKITKRGLRFIQ
ncbi:glycosyltransferase [uncultured Lutibacter sp.]|uniref:glycosyltransferase family 2 protein n=1 Tax=uncultured Lutibacter sp. TaxID=437739 RepID=UPI0026227C41|nr:glycosyltransferase [uncultured Lutibacter sp.]